MKTNSALRQQALALSPVERASLIEDLLASFDESSRLKNDAAWAVEVEARLDAYHRGEMTTISHEESQRQIRDL